MNYTLKEFYHVHGHLEPVQIERLIEIAELASAAVDCLPCLQESLAGFPDEDALDRVYAHADAKKLCKLREELDSLGQQAEYGMDELNKVRVALKQLEKGIGNG